MNVTNFCHRALARNGVEANGIEIMKRNSCASNVSQTSSRKKPREQRRWTAVEEDAIIQYLRNTVVAGKVIEKPTAEAYYEEMLQQVKITNCTANQLKSKVKNMKKTYMATVIWRNQVGQLFRENQGEEEFMRITLQRCPTFEMQSEIYGTELNIYPHRTTTRRLQEENGPAQDLVVDCDVDDRVLEDAKMEPVEMLETSSCSSAYETVSTLPDLMSISHNSSAISLLAKARKQKTAIENRKLDLDYMKFEFEKKKWEQELGLRKQEIDLKQQEIALEEKRVEKNYLLSRYELELKYGTKTVCPQVDAGN